tara:strand:- start:693 stop:1571 length:879 start_codon:yes stop_codon:yes gene_type:complete
MADADSRTFEVDGKKYKVVKPTLEVLNEATKLRSRTFNEALQAGDMLREQLEDQLKKRNLWNDDLEIEYQTLRKEVVRLTGILSKGGISLKQARDIALDVAQKRARMVDMLSSRSSLDSNSCEGKADAARFNYLFANCLVYNDTDEKYFPNGLVDYLLNQEDPVAAAGATEFYYLISNSEDPTDDLVENKFLKQYKFVDDDYRLIDKEGRLIDNDGKHIDEEGYYIEWLEDGTSRRVDVNGNIINSDGTPQLEFTPFLDDDGNPVVLSDDKPKKKTPRKRSPRKKKTETADS